MPSIIISADAAEVEQRIAESVADRLEYEYLGPAFLKEIAERYDASAKELDRALEARGARLGILNRTRETNLSFVQAAVLERFLDSNVVCAGLCAHLYVREIPHVMNIRVLSDLRQRTNRIAAESGATPGQVRRQLERQEERRRRWSREVFGVDESNPSNYDMVISLGQIEEERVAKTICATIGDRRFKEMTYSRKCVADQVLVSHVRATLVRQFPSVRIGARDGAVTLGLGSGVPGWRKRADRVKQLVETWLNALI